MTHLSLSGGWLGQETISGCTFVPQEDCKQFKMVSEPLYSRVGCPPSKTQIRPPPRTQIKNAAAFIWLIFSPEFQSPYLHFSSPCKKGQFKMEFKPWLLWFNGLNMGLPTNRSQVQFLVRARAWVAGQVPSWGSTRSNHMLVFLSLSFSFPSPLYKNK